MRCPYRSSAIVTDECPMYVESAFALTPAAIISDVKVWRHSCIPIGSRPAFPCPPGPAASPSPRRDAAPAPLMVSELAGLRLLPEPLMLRTESLAEVFAAFRDGFV